MGLLDKFLDAIKLNDDFDEDEFYDEDDFDDDDDFEEEKPKRRFFKKIDEDLEDFDDDDYEEPKKSSKEPKYTYKQSAASSTAKASKTSKNNSKITPMRKRTGAPTMEVIVIRPTTMEDTRDIADTLMNNSTVILNLEGLDVYLAQRIIDFTCGSCYSLSGSLQKITSYIYILTPAGVDISGDFQEILNGAVDITSI